MGFGGFQEDVCYIECRANISRSGRHPGVIITAEHYSRKSEMSSFVLFISRLALVFIIYPIATNACDVQN